MHPVAKALNVLFVVRAVSGARLEVDDNLVLNSGDDTTNEEFDYYDYAPDVGAFQGELVDETVAYDGNSSSGKRKFLFGRRRRTTTKYVTNFDFKKVFTFESCKHSSLASISDDHFLSEPSANESGWSKEISGASDAESLDMTNGELVQATDVYDANANDQFLFARRRRAPTRRRRSAKKAKKSSSRRRNTKVVIRARATGSSVTVRSREISTVGTLELSLVLNHTFTKGWKFEKKWTLEVFRTGVVAVYISAGLLFSITMTGNAGFKLTLPIDWNFCVGVRSFRPYKCGANKLTARKLSFKHWLAADVTGKASATASIGFEVVSIVSISAEVSSTMTLSTTTGCDLKFEWAIKAKALKTVTKLWNMFGKLVKKIGICLPELNDIVLGQLAHGTLATMKCTFKR